MYYAINIKKQQMKVRMEEAKNVFPILLRYLDNTLGTL